MYALFINMSVRNRHIATAGGIAMRFPIEPGFGLFIGPVTNQKAVLKRTIFGLPCLPSGLAAFSGTFVVSKPFKTFRNSVCGSHGLYTYCSPTVFVAVVVFVTSLKIAVGFGTSRVESLDAV